MHLFHLICDILLKATFFHLLSFLLNHYLFFHLTLLQFEGFAYLFVCLALILALMYVFEVKQVLNGFCTRHLCSFEHIGGVFLFVCVVFCLLGWFFSVEVQAKMLCACKGNTHVFKIKQKKADVSSCWASASGSGPVEDLCALTPVSPWKSAGRVGSIRTGRTGAQGVGKSSFS